MDHYQQIAEAAYALLPQGCDETLIWAEFDDGLVNSSLFARGPDGVVRHYQLSETLREAIRDHWRTWQLTRPAWRTFAYRVKNDTYSLDLEFAERFRGASEWQERLHRVAEISVGRIARGTARGAEGHHRYETSLLSTGCSKGGEWSFGR